MCCAELCGFRLREATHGVRFMGMMYFEELECRRQLGVTGCVPSITRNADLWSHKRPCQFTSIQRQPPKSAVWRIYRKRGYTISLMYRLSHEIVNQPDRTWAFLELCWHVKFSRNPFVQVTNCTNASQFWRSACRASRTGHRQAPHRTDQRPKACGAIY